MTPSTDPTDYVYVPLRVELYADLVRRSGKADVSHFIDHCVATFLDDTEGDPVIWTAEYIEKHAEEQDEAFREKFGDPGRGYQWGTVFLPNGTEILMTYAGQNSHAQIRHAGFWHGEERMSPSQFASRVANNTSRNAWRDLYIKFPGDASWTPADRLRRIKPMSLDDF